MATWITHMMIADNLLDRGLNLDKKGFCVGNVAPDCNVENEDWTEFTPPRKVTHWMNGSSKLTADYEEFYNQYIKSNSFDSKEEYAFFMGYYTHLIADVEFQRFIREEQRVRDSFKRIKANSELSDKVAGYPEDFDTLKKVFGRNYIFHDITLQEWEYLASNPESGYLTVLRSTDEFPDYLNILPKGAISRKIKIMAEAPEIVKGDNEMFFFSKEEFERYVEETSDLIYRMIKSKEV